MDRLTKIFKMVEKYAGLNYQFYAEENTLSDLDNIKNQQRNCVSSAFDELLELYKTGELKNLAKLKDITSSIPLDELEAMCNAKNEGRYIIPPCKVWDKCYLLLEKDNNEFDIVESRLLRLTVKKDLVVAYCDFNCAEIGNTLEFYNDEIEKCIFATEEQAKKALEGLK